MRFFEGSAAGLRRAWCVGLIGAAVSAQAAAGTVDVRVVPGAAAVDLNETFDLLITADVSEPLLGFGFELTFNDQLFDLQGAFVSPELTPTGKAGGDFISALAFPEPIFGDDVLLAMATFTAVEAGTGTFGLHVAQGNLIQGFAEVPIGAMAEFDVAFAEVIVRPALDDLGGGGPSVPEPATLTLLALGGLVALRRPR